MDQLKNMTQRTCIYLIANELQILALNHSHFAIGCVPSRALQNMTCSSVNSESRIEAGIAVGQSKASHLVDLVGKVRVHCSWIFSNLHDDCIPNQFPS